MVDKLLMSINLKVFKLFIMWQDDLKLSIFLRVFENNLKNNIQKLQTRCQTYSEYIERLEIEVNKKGPKDCTKHRKQIEERDTQIIELQQELNNSYKISLQQFDKQDNQMRNLRSLYEQQKHEQITMQETNSLIQKKLINEQLIVIELKDRIIQLEKEQEDYQQQLRDKDKLIEVQKEQAQIAMNLFYKDIESLSNEIEQKISNLSYMINCDNYFLKGIYQNVNKVFSQISLLQQQSKDQQLQKQEQQEQQDQLNDRLNTEINNLKQQINNRQQQIDDLNQIIQDQKQQITLQTDKINKQQEELEDLQSEESSLRYSQMGDNKEVEIIRDDSDYYFAI
ncbi:hypothetical protein pb186bvf_009777 [Paramecium bursaria]